MNIHQTIKESIKDAMRAKDEIRLMVLRALTTSFTNEAVATGKTPQDFLDDEQTMTVIQREAKRRKDSIEQFEKGNRPDLAESEKAELKIIEEFLPEMMTEEEINNFVKLKLTELGITSKQEAGKATGLMMKDLKGKADGLLVKKAVENNLV